MKTMGWNTPLTCLRGTRSTVDLAAFLSTVWLNSDHIDMMMEDLTARVKADPDLANFFHSSSSSGSDSLADSHVAGSSMSLEPPSSDVVVLNYAGMFSSMPISSSFLIRRLRAACGDDIAPPCYVTI
ncbi:hypothetical protein B0H10DRAFT_2214785 [Mycena sp. CBHHK59/15]|nr:hypothetical protein B0H10DRAFT_2214785 [Mycena sp. CBHHK59/15]